MTPRDRYTCEWVECLHAGLGLGLAPSAESWHCDEAELALPDDLLFGGWWNFDDEDQFFSCVPGSHVAVSGNKGFALVKDKEQIKAYKQASAKVRIPPGSIIVFSLRCTCPSYNILAVDAVVGSGGIAKAIRPQPLTQPLTSPPGGTSVPRAATLMAFSDASCRAAIF